MSSMLTHVSFHEIRNPNFIIKHRVYAFIQEQIVSYTDILEVNILELITSPNFIKPIRFTDINETAFKK